MKKYMIPYYSERVMKKLFITSDKRKPPLNVGGFDITVLASTHDTMGYEIFVQKGQEGKGPGPHFHPWDETFYILNGKLHCGIDEDEFVALPGTLVHIPGGKTHWFKFGVGGAEFLAITLLFGNDSMMKHSKPSTSSSPTIECSQS